jgi:hypothetical protein
VQPLNVQAFSHRCGFFNIQWTLDDMVSEGNKVAARYAFCCLAGRKKGNYNVFGQIFAIRIFM